MSKVPGIKVIPQRKTRAAQGPRSAVNSYEYNIWRRRKHFGNSTRGATSSILLLSAAVVLCAAVVHQQLQVHHITSIHGKKKIRKIQTNVRTTTKGRYYRRAKFPKLGILWILYQNTEAFCHNLWILTTPEKSGSVHIHKLGNPFEDFLVSKGVLRRPPWLNAGTIG